MLIEFRFKNYACFKDEQILSLVASSDQSHKENVIWSAADTKFNLLRSIVVYGANASGKTKLLQALDFVREFVVESASRKPIDPTGTDPFLLDPKSAWEPSEFEITFMQEKVRYQYGFAVDRNRIYLEYLYAAPRGRTVPYFQREFDRETQKESFRFGPSLKGENERIRDLTRENALFLSVAATFNHPMLSAVYRWFSNQMLTVDVDRTKTDILSGSSLTERKYRTQIKQFLKYADLGITDFRYEEEPALSKIIAERGPDTTIDLGQARRVEFTHAAGRNESVSFPIEAESAGTEQLFYLTIALTDALSEGKITLIDELDSSLHPMLARSLIELVHSPSSNKHNAQLIFNTHDTTLLDNALFRRDQVWFTEKEQSGEAHLYSLLEYSPRKGESLAKGYLQGRYGAIPFLGDPSLVFVEEAT